MEIKIYCSKNSRKLKKLRFSVLGEYEECIRFFCELVEDSSVRPNASLDITNIGECYQGKIVCKTRSSKQLKQLEKELAILIDKR